jgi:hypothetical protein
MKSKPRGVIRSRFYRCDVRTWKMLQRTLTTANGISHNFQPPEVQNTIKVRLENPVLGQCNVPASLGLALTQPLELCT